GGGCVGEVGGGGGRRWVGRAWVEEGLSQRGYRFFFRVSSLRPYVESTVGVVRDALRPARVAILYASTPGASQLATRQREALAAASVQVAVFEPFSPGLADFTPLLSRARDRDAEALRSHSF